MERLRSALCSATRLAGGSLFGQGAGFVFCLESGVRKSRYACNGSMGAWVRR